MTAPRVMPLARAVADSSTSYPLAWPIQSPAEMGRMAKSLAGRVLLTKRVEGVAAVLLDLVAAGGLGGGSAVASLTPMAVSRLERGADPVMVRHGLTVSPPMVVSVPE